MRAASLPPLPPTPASREAPLEDRTENDRRPWMAHAQATAGTKSREAESMVLNVLCEEGCYAPNVRHRRAQPVPTSSLSWRVMVAILAKKALNSTVSLWWPSPSGRFRVRSGIRHCLLFSCRTRQRTCWCSTRAVGIYVGTLPADHCSLAGVCAVLVL